MRYRSKTAPALALLTLLALAACSPPESAGEAALDASSHHKVEPRLPAEDSAAIWSNPLVQTTNPDDLRDVLQKPDGVTLYTICEKQELRESRSVSEIEALPTLDDYRVLDSKVVTDAEGRRLIDSFLKSVQDGKVESVMCFRPHHAIRVRRDSRVVEILVCFECYNYKVNPDGGYNDVILGNAVVEKTWRDVVARYALKDITRPPDAARTE